MNDYDKAGRYLVKRDSAGFLRWLANNPVLVFHAWIDARRLALPNQRDLTNDLVAALTAPDGLEALCVELQASARPDTLLRLLAYLGRLLTEPGDQRSLPLIAAGCAVLNLTGRNPADTLTLGCSASAACQLQLRVIRRNLCDEDAAALMAGVEAGEISSWQLGWLPLMRGGAETSIIKAWRALAERRLTGVRDREDLGSIALVFAALAGCRPLWEQGLRRWNVETSPFLDEIRAEGHDSGRLEEARALLLRLGRQKFKKAPNRKQRQELAAIGDLDRLEALAERLLEVDSWGELLAEA